MTMNKSSLFLIFGIIVLIAILISASPIVVETSIERFFCTQLHLKKQMNESQNRYIVFLKK